MKLMTSVICLLLLTGICTAQPTYTGAYGSYPHCQSCHSSGSPSNNQFPWWNTTPHATAYDNHPEVQWNVTCLPCHTTGWNTGLANGGFDDFFSAGDTLGMQELRNVQCEVCHGPTDEIPHPSTTAVNLHAEVCGGCHTGLGRPTYDEWSEGSHSTIASSATQQLACARCHEAGSAAAFLETSHPLPSLPEDPVWQLTCAACHATHAPTTYGPQLYLEADSLCRSCHTMEEAAVGEVPHSPQKEMLLGLGFGGYEWPGYPYNNSCHETYLPEPCTVCHMYNSTWGNPDTTATGHNLQPNILLCVMCHGFEIPPDSSFNLNGTQTEIDSLLAILAIALAQADTTTSDYDQAKFDYDFVQNDGSRGVHNFLYAQGLLLSSIEGLGYQAVPPVAQPESYQLVTIHPNPFNSQTKFTLNLPANQSAALAIYDLSGRMAATLLDGSFPAGELEITWDAGEFPSGIYLYRLTTEQSAITGKVVLLK